MSMEYGDVENGQSSDRLLPVNRVTAKARRYYRILRRREARAKAKSQNKSVKSVKCYRHESRHLHAIRRARGKGGRFLTKQEKKAAAVAKVDGSPRNTDKKSFKDNHNFILNVLVLGVNEAAPKVDGSPREANKKSFKDNHNFISNALDLGVNEGQGQFLEYFINELDLGQFITANNKTQKVTECATMTAYVNRKFSLGEKET